MTIGTVVEMNGRLGRVFDVNTDMVFVEWFDEAGATVRWSWEQIVDLTEE